MYSPNMLKTFNTCPKKFYIKYINKISIPQKASVFEKGKRIHALANYYLRGDDITNFEKILKPDEKIIWNNLKKNEYFQKTYINSEYNLSCKTGDFWIGGRIDAVVKDENFYYVLDYKTGQIPQNPEYDFQTIIYLLCASKKFGNNTKFIYLDLKNNINHIINFAGNNSYINLITEACHKAETYELTDDVEYTKKCDFCEFKKICKII